MKRLAPSRPKPYADDGDDDDSEGDQDLAVHHPAPILPTDHGLAPLNETMVSTLSSITDL